MKAMSNLCHLLHSKNLREEKTLFMFEAVQDSTEHGRVLLSAFGDYY